MRTITLITKGQPPAGRERSAFVQPAPLVKESSLPGASLNLTEILTPIGFSECGEQALRYTVSLAQQFSASLTLLHVIFRRWSCNGVNMILSDQHT